MINNERHFKNVCKRKWKALIDHQTGRAKSLRELDFKKMLELLDKHLEKEGAKRLSKSEKYKLLRKRIVAFKDVADADFKDAPSAEQTMRSELACNYLRELENIALKRNVLQLKVPSGITLTEHEAQYLTKFSNRLYVCFLCRVCKWYGRNDHWATSLSGGAFRCCNCGFRYVTGGRKHQRASLKSVLN